MKVAEKIFYLKWQFSKSFRLQILPVEAAIFSLPTVSCLIVQRKVLILIFEDKNDLVRDFTHNLR